MSFFDSYRKKMQMPSKEEVLPGRVQPIDRLTHSAGLPDGLANKSEKLV